MNTEITIIASIFLLLGGLAAFPFTLDYSNTLWMPRWMRPDIDYLERPFRYDYPVRWIQTRKERRTDDEKDNQTLPICIPAHAVAAMDGLRQGYTRK